MIRFVFLLCSMSVAMPKASAWDLVKNDILQRSPTRAYYQFRKTFKQDPRKITMELFVFDTRRCGLRVLDAR